MAQSRINTIGVLFAGLSAAATVIVACEGPESFHGRSPGSSVSPAGGSAGLGNGAGGGAAGTPGPGGLASIGGADQPGAGGDSIAAGGTAGLGTFGGTLGGGAGGDGRGGQAATGGSATGGSAAGGTSAAAGASGHAGGGAGGASAVAAGGAGGSLMMAAGMGGTCATCVLSIQCRNYAPADVTAMNAEIWISNTGTASIPLRQIKVRYYYVNEGGPMALEIFDKAFKPPDGADSLTSTASFSMTTGKLAAPRMDFSEVAIGGNEVLAGAFTFYFKMSIHDQAHSRLDLSNDYSNGPTTIGPCPHLVGYVGGVVAAGVLPH